MKKKKMNKFEKGVRSILDSLRKTHTEEKKIIKDISATVTSFKNATYSLPISTLEELRKVAYSEKKTKSAIVRDALVAYFKQFKKR